MMLIQPNSELEQFSSRKLIEDVIHPGLMSYCERYHSFLPLQHAGDINVMWRWYEFIFNGSTEPITGALQFRNYMDNHPDMGSYVYGSAVRNRLSFAHDIDMRVFTHGEDEEYPPGCKEKIQSFFQLKTDIHQSGEYEVCCLQEHLSLLDNMILEAVPIPWNVPILWRSKALALHRMETLTRIDIERFISDFTFKLAFIHSKPSPVRLALFSRVARICLAAAVMSVLRIYPNPTDTIGGFNYQAPHPALQ